MSKAIIHLVVDIVVIVYIGFIAYLVINTLHTSKEELTIYTTVDIYYVNTADLEITTESGHTEEFETFVEMKDWLEVHTAHDVDSE